MLQGWSLDRDAMTHLICVGERSNFKKIPTHTQDYGDGIATRGESVRPRILVDRKRKRYDNAVDVVVRLHDPTDLSTASTPPPRSAHVRLGDVPRTLDPAECQGRASSARWHDDGDDEATSAGLRLSTATI